METRSAQEIWETALGQLQIQVSKPNYRTWLEKTVGLSYQNNQFMVGVPNTFVAEYLEKNQRSLIEKVLIGLTSPNVKVLFQVANTSPGPSPTLRASPNLNPKYTFNSFIVGNCNRLAHAAALGIFENLGKSYNPLFIYGGAGLGKTHLLHAIGHLALEKHLKVLYVSSEQFTNDFINAIRTKKTEEFRDKYRSVDMLLVDDIHFIIGKAQTEESFFHTFDELHNANRQIAITCNCLPKSMPLLQERLRSRFEWGLIANLQPPDCETRLAILKVKAEQKEVRITPDVLQYIAENAQQNIRELEGCLNRVITYAKLFRALPTQELAAEALKDISTKAPQNGYVTPAQVIEVVAASFQLTPSELKSRKRKQATIARQMAVYLIRQESNCSLAQIGQELGGRDTSFISRACEKIARDIDASPFLRSKIQEIKQEIHLKQAKLQT